MKKMNNKGFMLVEILIVSIFISSILIVLFVQFKKINNSYEVSFKYNNVDGLYLLNNIKKRIITNLSSNDSISNSYAYYESNLPIDGYITVYNKKENSCTANTYDCEMIKAMNINSLYIVGKGAKQNMIDDKNLSIDFRDYIDYMNFNTDVGTDYSNYFIVAEFNNNTFASININNSI